MLGLRTLFVALLLIALVAPGAMAQDGGGEKVVKKVVLEVKKACGPDCTKPCCADAELVDETGKGCGGCADKGADDKCEGCPGEKKAGESCESCPKSQGRAVLMLGGGAPNRDVLKQALAELEKQIDKLKAEAAELRAANKTADAEALTAKAQALKEHQARLAALVSQKSGDFRVVGLGGGTSSVRIVKAGGCGGKCADKAACGGKCATKGACGGRCADKAACGGKCATKAACGGKCADKGACGGKCATKGSCGGKCATKGACGGKCATKGACGGKCATKGSCGGKCATKGACGGKCATKGSCGGAKKVAFLGIQMAPIDEGGVRIAGTVPMSPAALGGLVADDILLALNGEKIRSVEDASRIIQALAPGSEIRIAAKRGEGNVLLRLALGARPVELEENLEIEFEEPRFQRRRIIGVPGGGLMRGRAVPATALRPAMARRTAMPEMAAMNARLQELKAEAQRCLAVGDFVRAAEMSRTAHEVSRKLQEMHRRAAPVSSTGALHAARFEERLRGVEMRLARIEAMLHRIMREIDDDDDDEDDDD